MQDLNFTLNPGIRIVLLSFVRNLCTCEDFIDDLHKCNSKMYPFLVDFVKLHVVSDKRCNLI